MNFDPESTLMFREAAESSAVLAKQYKHNKQVIADIANHLKNNPPKAVITCARGSSDHAATFAKYLIETRVGTLTSSAAPSISSVYFAKQNLQNCLFLAISQSGKSPDLLATALAAKNAGACVVAIVNVEDSPLAIMADYCLPLCAGDEKSVAATKSYIASLAAIIHLVAEWSDDSELKSALEQTPKLLEQAWHLDWSSAVTQLADAQHLFVMARGLGLGIALESALKCKETAGLHAEGFSSAEVLHGPQALLGHDFPALILAQNDETLSGVKIMAKDLVARNVPVLIAGATIQGAYELPTVTCHPVIEPILLIQCVYKMINALAVGRGMNPDQPAHLRKVTETV
ncbi:MAG TPA: SIS domain-containing protein [Arenimonas sp.]|nr:SIS domain-containing protein [Arenimonas sp.]